MLRTPPIAMAVAGISLLTACDYLPAAAGGYTYRAEVGYREGGKELWFVGADKSLEECTAESQRRFNAMNEIRLGNTDPNRAFSYACRKMQGEKFLERVR